MDNRTMARLLAETADLMEIDGADSFRIRSYRRAADAAEQTTVDLTEAASDPAQVDGDSTGSAKAWRRSCRRLPRPGRCRSAKNYLPSMARVFWSC